MDELQSTVGNRAVLRMFRDGDQPTLAASAMSGNLTVARLMDADGFKTATSARGPRNKVKPVAAALDRYIDTPPENGVWRRVNLQVLINECDTYLAYPDDRAKRKAGVRALRAEADDEMPVQVALETAVRERDPVRKVVLLNDALELHLAAQRAGVTISSINFGELIGNVVKVMTPVEKQSVVATDLAKLQVLAADATLPDVTRAVLAEVLANAPNVKLQPGGPGAKARRPWEQQTEAYTVNHAMAQSGGEAERLGSLAHELTHVAVSEAYENTSFFFMIRSGATADEIRQRAQSRQGRIDELVALLATDNALAADQKTLVANKLDYGSEDKLALYAARYGDAARGAERDKKQGWEQRRDFYASEEAGTRTISEALADSDLKSSLLVEYDTVMNQMLVYMHMWGVPADNALYAKIRQVAEEARAQREAARNG